MENDFANGNCHFGSLSNTFFTLKMSVGESWKLKIQISLCFTAFSLPPIIFYQNFQFHSLIPRKTFQFSFNNFLNLQFSSRKIHEMNFCWIFFLLSDDGNKSFFFFVKEKVSSPRKSSNYSIYIPQIVREKTFFGKVIFLVLLNEIGSLSWDIEVEARGALLMDVC